MYGDDLQRLTRVTSAGLAHLLRLGHGARADRVSRAVANESAAGGGPLLLGLCDDGLTARIQHEQTGWSLEQAGAATDAAIALHVHYYAASRVHPIRSARRPGGGTVEGVDRRAVSLLHHLAQVVEREHRHVLDARVDIVDGRRGPIAEARLEQR